MYILIALTTLVTTYLTYSAFNFWQVRSKLSSHGVSSKGAFPLFGNMAKVLFQKLSFAEVVSESYKSSTSKYVAFFDFQTPIVLIRDPELIKSITIKNFDIFPDHYGVVTPENDSFFGNALFNSKGHNWRHNRNLLTLAFTSSKMKYIFDVISKVAETFTASLKDVVTSGEEEFELKELFTRYTNDVVASAAFGIQINSMKNPKNEFYSRGREMVNFKGTMSLKILLFRHFPRIMKLLGIQLFNPKSVEYFKKQLENIVTCRDKGKITRPDMLQLLMDARGKENGMSMENLASQTFGFYFASLETSANALSFFIYAIALNPDVYGKLEVELEKVKRDTNGKLSYESLSNMPYLDAAMCEALRYFPSGSVVDRVSAGKFELPPNTPGEKPFLIERGQTIWIPIGPLLTDPEYFEESGVFRPERFLGNKISLNSPPFHPFGVGPRMCLGYRFAMMQIKVVLVNLLWKFKLSVCERTNVPMVFDRASLVFTSKGGFWMKIEEKK